MRLLVFSDSHGRVSNMREIIALQARATDLVLHLGDLVSDALQMKAEFPDVPLAFIGGNNDFDSTLRETVLELGGCRLFLAHGHQYAVKQGSGTIAAAARKKGCKLVLFGHTHEPFQDYRDGLYLLNPGSISLPMRGGPTYGIVDLTPGGIVAYYNTIG